MKNYILGLDIGIGSVGWAVLNLDDNRLEDFGVRLFDSGESNNGKDRLSQDRRKYRGTRRLVRRRSHRKDRLKHYLENIGLVTIDRINRYYETSTNNAIALRYKGLSEKLDPEEIVACLIHISNNRGYKDFYEINIDDIEDADEKKEYEKEISAVSHINELMEKGKYRTPAEMIMKCCEFEEPNSVFRKYHNSSASEQTNLISRAMLEKEVSLILECQSKYYKCLNKNAVDIIKGIIFAQRDFETGPGNENDPYRKYTGYIDTLGKCRYYKDQDRGSRFTVIADVYALVNTLSQYNYSDKDGVPCFDSKIAKELINTAVSNGTLSKRDISAISKKHNIDINDSNSDTPITKCFKYIKTIKPVFDEYGYDWNELTENYTDTENNLLNKVGIILSQAQTPERRKTKLEALSDKLDNELISKLVRLKFSGTCNVSYKYMQGSIESFCEGEIYGKYQKNFKDEQPDIDESAKPEKLPPFRSEDDCDFYKNPVVFRSINETRKLINAVIDRYGYPNAVNIETADELNRTYSDRMDDNKRNRNNEKENDKITKEIIDTIGCDDKTARGLIEKYKLWEAQEGKCLYSGETIDKAAMLRDKDHIYEVDHIIPYSLILDNTLNNKALVLASENQRKGQRTPLMYMNAAQAADFRKRVNMMMRSKKCSKKKSGYLMLADLKDSKLLGEWKSRNLNDTRYICKYLVNYLRNNLRFNTTNEMAEAITIRNKSRVFAVKSKFTSMFRRQWLNDTTWGRDDKGELKKITLLDHAADAIVIANCRPEYVILAGEKKKLSRMYFDAGKKITEEYENSKKACIESLYKFSRMDRRTAERLLSGHSSRLTPIIEDLAEEVDKRLWDVNIYELFWKKESDTQSPEEIFRENMRSLYREDPGFAESVTMPLISLKPNRRYRGAVTDDNPICIREIDGSDVHLSRKNIADIKEKDIKSIYTGDNALIDTLHDILDGRGSEYNVGTYLKDNNIPYFSTKSGKRVNKVTVIGKTPARWLIKDISEKNRSILDDRQYYCAELYKDNKGHNNLQGIAMSDIVCKNGKLWLKPDFKYPDDYSDHVMYIFPGDYLRIKSTSKKSGEKLKFEGYFKSIKDVNTNRFRYITDNKPFDVDKNSSIAQNDIVIKMTVDITGKVYGENDGRGISCGEPLSLLKEKN